MALLVSGALLIGLIAFTRWALVGIPLVLASLALMALSINMPARTGKGTAMYRRVLGFREMFAAGGRPPALGGRTEPVQPLPALCDGVRHDRALGPDLRPAQRRGRGAGRADGLVGVTPALRLDHLLPQPQPLRVPAAGAFSAVQRSSAGGAGGMSGFGGGGFSGGGFGGGGGGSW
ncbi:MAG: hypothetical protein R2704_04265 [Microthrixaceae bacterium]